MIYDNDFWPLTNKHLELLKQFKAGEAGGWWKFQRKKDGKYGEHEEKDGKKTEVKFEVLGLLHQSVNYWEMDKNEGRNVLKSFDYKDMDKVFNSQTNNWELP